MSALLKMNNVRFFKPANFVTVYAPQRSFTFLTMRRSVAVSSGSLSIQSRQAQISSRPFSPLLQKATIADEVVFVGAVVGLYYLAGVKSERKSKEEVIRDIINDLEIFRSHASDLERIGYANHVMKAIEPHFAGAHVLRSDNLKDYVKNRSFLISDLEFSRHVINNTLSALRDTEHMISSLNEFDEAFLDYMAIGWSLPRYPKCEDGFSLLTAVKL